MFLSESVDVFERLVIVRLPLLIAHIIASCFLLFVLVYLVYKPFKNWLNKREKHFSDKQSAITKNLNEAENLRRTEKENLTKSKILIQNMIQKSKTSLEEERKKVLKLTEKERIKIISEAQFLSDQKKNSLKKEINKTIIDNSVLLVKKILNSEINAQKHQVLIEDFIQQLEEESARKKNLKKEMKNEDK